MEKEDYSMDCNATGMEMRSTSCKKLFSDMKLLLHAFVSCYFKDARFTIG